MAKNMLERLSRRELSILLHLALNPNVDLWGLRICQELNMGSSRVYPALERLERLGLVEGREVPLHTAVPDTWVFKPVKGLVERNGGLVRRVYKSTMPRWTLQNVERRWPQMLRKLGVDKIPNIWSRLVRKLALRLA